MWGWIAIGAVSIGSAVLPYFFSSEGQNPNPQDDGTGKLLKISLYLGIGVSLITLYQFYKGR